MNACLKKWPGLAMLVAISLLLASVYPAAALDDVTFTGKALFDVNIRAQPGTSGALIGVLTGGREVSAIGRTAANNWIQIQDGDTTGWVAAWLLVFSGDTALLPVTTGVQPAPANGGGPFALRSPYNINIRAGPGIHTKVLGILPHSTEARATGRNELSSWVRIRHGSIEGWVAAWLVTLTGDPYGLPVEGGAQPPPEEEPTGTPPTPTPEPDEDKDEDEPLPSDITISTPYRVNIRSAPALSGKVIDQLIYGQKAAALGRNAGNNWIQVSRGSTRGWVAAWVVVASDDTSGLPVTSNSAEVAFYGGSITGQGVYDTFIRLGPGLNFGVHSTLPASTPVPLLARTKASNWILIDYGGTEGWVAAWVIVANADWNNLPVEEEPSP